ncbi:MAG: hypothetical protein WC980_10420 [Candidatus Brocadiia bacterium]
MKYLTAISVLAVLVILAAGQAFSEDAWPQPGKPPIQINPPPPPPLPPIPITPPKPIPPVPNPQEPQPGTPALQQEKPLTWQATTLVGALSAAKAQKKVSYIYFYFKDKEDFPKNYDEALLGYSDKRAVFARILVKTDNKGKIVDDDLSSFFTKHKLAKSANAVLLDQYGNLLSTVATTAPNKITAAIDSADKKVAGIGTDFKQRDEKAAKLEKELEKDRVKKTPEYIKALVQIAEDKYQGYPSVEKAKGKLKELDQSALNEYKNIIKAYSETAEDEREPEKVTGQLDSLAKTYKGLPAEKTVQEGIKTIKKGELPAITEEKPVEEAKKPADGENAASSAEKPADKSLSDQPADKK